MLSQTMTVGMTFPSAGLGHMSLGNMVKLTVFQLSHLSSGDLITHAYTKRVHLMISLRAFNSVIQ